MSDCTELRVCVKGKACARTNGAGLFDRLNKLVKKKGLEGDFEIKKAKCFGLCEHAPVVAMAVTDFDCYYSVSDKSDCKKLLKHQPSSKKLSKLLVKQKRKKK